MKSQFPFIRCVLFGCGCFAPWDIFNFLCGQVIFVTKSHHSWLGQMFNEQCKRQQWETLGLMFSNITDRAALLSLWLHCLQYTYTHFKWPPMTTHNMTSSHYSKSVRPKNNGIWIVISHCVDLRLWELLHLKTYTLLTLLHNTLELIVKEFSILWISPSSDMLSFDGHRTGP